MKRLRIYLLAGALYAFTPAAVEAQDIVALNQALNDTTWKSKTEFGANFNQGSFNSAWTGGGVNSIALGVFFNALRELKSGKHTWRNDLQAQYGIVRNKGVSARKNIDRLFFDSKYGYSIGKYWSLVGNVNFLTQFGPGYSYETDAEGKEVRKRISGFFAPAYLTEAIGIQYSPDPSFYVTFSPGALRQTFVTDKKLYVNTPGGNNYGVPIGKIVRNEVALMQIVANLDRNIAKDLNLKARYLLFAATDKDRKTAFHTDHRLDASITAKIHKYFNVNLGCILIYDDDQVSKVQFAQALSVGFLYAF